MLARIGVASRPTRAASPNRAVDQLLGDDGDELLRLAGFRGNKGIADIPSPGRRVVGQLHEERQGREPLDVTVEVHGHRAYRLLQAQRLAKQLEPVHVDLLQVERHVHRQLQASVRAQLEVLGGQHQSRAPLGDLGLVLLAAKETAPALPPPAPSGLLVAEIPVGIFVIVVFQDQLQSLQACHRHQPPGIRPPHHLPESLQVFLGLDLGLGIRAQVQELAQVLVDGLHRHNFVPRDADALATGAAPGLRPDAHEDGDLLLIMEPQHPATNLLAVLGLDNVAQVLAVLLLLPLGREDFNTQHQTRQQQDR